MLSMRKLSLFLLLAVGLAIQSAVADEVRLKNGDVISGTIVKKETDKLVLRTSYAGEIHIAWSQILQLSSSETVKIFLSDQTHFSGVIEPSDDGRALIRLEQYDAYADIDLNELTYINASAEVSGMGVIWSGQINVGGAFTEGNTDTSLLRVGGESIARTKVNRFTIGGQVNRAKSNNVDTEYNSRANAKYDHFLSKKWYLYSNSTLENDRFRDINLRSTVGGGSGYQLYERDDLNLAIEGGLNYLHADYDVAEDDSYAIGRWAVRYDQKVYQDIKLFHQHEVLFSLEEFANTLVFSKTGLQVPIAEKLNASTQINLDYNNQPVADRKKLDKTLLFSLGYGW